MKTALLILICLLVNMTVHAETCGLYAIKGWTELRANVVGVVIAKGSLSETFFPVDRLQDHSFAPYFNKMMSGKFIIREKDLVIIKVEEIDLDTPDPLRPEKNSYRTFLKELECPQK